MSRPGNKPLQLPLHFPSLSLSASFHLLSPAAHLSAAFRFSVGCRHLVVDLVMAAEQGKPNKGVLQGLFFLHFAPVIGKTNSAMQQGFIFSFVLLLPFHSFSPVVKPQGPAGPGCLEERADCAQQIANHFCHASVLKAGEELFPAVQVTPPQAVSATQMLHRVKNGFSQFCSQITAPYFSLGQPEAVGSRNISRPCVWSFLDHLHLPAVSSPSFSGIHFVYALAL